VGKWSALKGTVPEPPAAPQGEWREKVESIRTEHAGKSLVELTAEFNGVMGEQERRKGRDSELTAAKEALMGLVIQALQESGSDIWRGNGYSFSESPEPYAVVENRAAVAEHFIPVGEMLAALDAGDLDMVGFLLERTRLNLAHVSVPWATLNGLVKSEAEAGELVMDGDIVRCSIPGVRVYLKPGISRRKVS
jgi:hypothetical protein